MRESISRAKIVIFTESILALEMFFAPVMVPFYLNYTRLSFEQMSFLFSIILISNWFLEVPTGAFSDLIGRKKAFLLGKLVYLVAMVSLFFVKDFNSLIFIALLFSLGGAIKSGNLSTILYDNLEITSKKEAYFKLNSQAYSVTFFSSAIASLIGGFIGSLNLCLPLVLDCICLSITILVSSTYLDEYNKNYYTNIHEFDSQILTQFKNIFIDGWKFVFTNQTIFLIFIFNAICFGFIRSEFNFYQPILSNVNIDLSLFGLILAGLNIVASLSSFTVSKLPLRYSKSYGFIGLTSLLIILSIIVLIVGKNYVIPVVLTFAIHQIIRGFINPYVEYLINKEIPKDNNHRTTIFSVSFFMTALTGSIFMALSGRVAENYGLVTSFVAFSILAAIFNFIIFIAISIFQKHRKSDFYS